MLGVRVINGQGQALRFGGEVMKNVAGYDVSFVVTAIMDRGLIRSQYQSFTGRGL